MAALDFLTQDSLIALEKASLSNVQPPRHGFRIPASKIGIDCERHLWADFRWISPPEEIDAKKQRIFDAGIAIEKAMLRDLGNMPGVKLTTVFDDTGKQIGISFADGHGFGYLDGHIWGLPEAPKVTHVVEVKSAKETVFNAIRKHGVKKEKPEHWAQFQMYMHTGGFARTLYALENKNTSERWLQRYEYDFDYATRLEAKATRIAFSEERPARGHEKPEDFGCMFCRHKAWCWNKTAALPEKNCRTCAHVTPVSKGGWACNRRHGDKQWLTREEQEAGCGLHLYNPHMINGTISGGNGETEVIYDLIDGTQFVNVSEG